ncbi:phosphonate ABC transporter substrate-binding protein [Halarcobacter ebronensis]|uniref:Phosphonate ABC transporter substrate-binding protein n=1 Tax=Halarcobacter ebronensis TaxID=1462615 RepID=A0A4Q1AJH7_9BACT|nr:phosphonate ABC transporter substrate-binding protein [Halarcobacter ebronensis]QKF81935.1 phosphonate ABC transporter, periplasmic phosphonate-binding protein [Halarcobacter ebronensis]RXK04346.1 phosphonate ABC transporter substrate-binding protein [Halarcobacter ebronensis]
MKIVKKLVVGALALTLGVTSMLGQEKWPEKIVFGVIPVAGSTSMKENFGPLADYLEKSLGIKVELKLAGDYTGIITGMQHKHIDVAYFGPKSYVEAAKRADAEALVVEVDGESGLPGYNGIIITKKGSGLKTLEDIKGKTWAFTSSQSTSGTLVPTVMFSKKGINPTEYFSKVLYSGGHEASILAVKAGKVDAASTNNLDFNRGLGKNWEKEDFNVLWTSDLIPGAPMAARKDLPTSLKMALKGAFISYDDPEGLKRLKNRGFIKGDDSVYNPVRDLMKLKEELKNKQ